MQHPVQFKVLRPGVERVAESVASQLQPRVTDLHDRIDRTTNGTDRLQDRMQLLEISVNQLTAELNQFGPTAVTEIRTTQSQASTRLDELANAIAKVETVVANMEAKPLSSTSSSYHKKGVMEHKIIMQQHRLGNDRKDYRNLLEKMKMP